MPKAAKRSSTTRRGKPDSEQVGPPAAGIYAMVLNGGCLEPLLSSESVVVFDPEEAPQIGDFVILWWTERREMPSIKRLCSNLPPWKLPRRWSSKSTAEPMLFIEQLSPRQRLGALCSDLLAVHKAVGYVPADLRGKSDIDMDLVRPIPTDALAA